MKLPKKVIEKIQKKECFTERFDIPESILLSNDYDERIKWMESLIDQITEMFPDIDIECSFEDDCLVINFK